MHAQRGTAQLRPTAQLTARAAGCRHDVFAAIADAHPHVFIWLPSAVIIFVLALVSS